MGDVTLRTPKEWQEVTGLEILDADGWRGRTGRDFTEAISEEEFRYRASFSTIRSTRPVWKETAAEALDERMNADVDEGPVDEDGEE